jgi:C-terminal processing protease CtpA/Prc
MDEFCGSATEAVIGALKAAGRARLVGRRTGGASGNPRTYLSAGGVRFTCSSWEETTPAGEPIEGRGITTRKW